MKWLKLSEHIVKRGMQMKKSNKILIERPKSIFFTREELDAIESIMSGGSGGGGTTTPSLPEPIEEDLKKKYCKYINFKSDPIWDIYVRTSVAVGLCSATWIPTGHHILYHFLFIVVGDSKWGKTAPDINDSIISGLGIRVKNVTSSDDSILEKPFDTGLSPLAKEPNEESYTFPSDITALLALVASKSTPLSWTLTALGYIMQENHKTVDSTGVRKNFAWPYNVQCGMLYLRGYIRVAPGETKTVDVQGTVASPYATDYIPTPKVRLKIKVPVGVASASSAEDYVTCKSIDTNSLSYHNVNDSNSSNYKLEDYSRMLEFYEDTKSVRNEEDKIMMLRNSILNS